MEKRIVDVALRLGINELTLAGWEARFKIKAEFEARDWCIDLHHPAGDR